MNITTHKTCKERYHLAYCILQMADSFHVISDSDKKFLNDQYNQLTFVDDIDEFLCAHCQKVPLTHYYSACDHLFCDKCKQELDKESGKNWSCTKCEREISQTIIQKPEVEKKISSLNVYCLNRIYGCQKTVELWELIKHLRNCPNTKENNYLLEISSANVFDSVILRLDKLTDRLDSMTEFLISNQHEMEAKMAPRLQITNVDGDFQVDDITNELQKSLQGFRIDFQMEVERMRTNTERKVAETINDKMLDLIKLQRTIPQLNQQTEKQTGSSIEMNDNTITEILSRIETDFKAQQRQFSDETAKEIKQLLFRILEIQKETETKFTHSIQSLSQQVESIKDEIRILKQHRKTPGSMIDLKSTKIQPKFKRQREYRSSINVSETIAKKNVNLRAASVMLSAALDEVSKRQTGNGYAEVIEDGYTWEIVNFKEKFKENERFSTYSPMFHINGYGCQAKLDCSRQGISMSVCFKDVNNVGVLDLKSLPRVTYTLCDVKTVGNAEKKNKIKVKDYLFNEKVIDAFDRYYFEELLGYKGEILTNRYINKNQLQINVSIKPPSPLQSLSTNGVLIWKLEKFHKKRQAVKDELVQSVQAIDYFYTHPNGYRVNAEISWDSLSNLYARISFVTGEFDTQLSQTFPHKTTVTLYDQVTHHHFNVTVNKDIKLSKWYNIDLIPNKEIVEGNYLKDGALILQIAIEPIK